MKTIKLSFSKAAIAVLLVSLVFVSCKKEPAEPPKQLCDYKAHFEQMEGFNGYFGDYVIKLEDGSTVLPCIVEDNAINKATIYEGMPITVSYKILGGEEGNCQIPYSPYILPDKPYYKARVTCLKEQELLECGRGWCGTKW